MTTPQHTAAAVSELSAALRTMLALAEEHPSLPGVYMTLSSITPDEISVQVDGPGELETWRNALGVNPEWVRLSVLHGDWHLRLTIHRDNVTLCLYTLFKPASESTPECAA
jgi:hypothetical protein